MYKSIPINVPTAPHSPSSTSTLHPSPGDPDHTVITMKTRVAIRDKNPHLFQVIPLRDARLRNDQDATKSNPGWMTMRLKDASNAKKPSVTREFTSTSPKKASQSQREQLLALGLTPSNENLPALLHGVMTSSGQNKTPICLDSKPHRDVESSRSLINGKYLTNDGCQLGSVLIPPNAGAGLLASGGFCLSHLAASSLQQGVSGELETSSPGVPACLVQKPTTAILFHDPVVIPSSLHPDTPVAPTQAEHQDVLPLECRSNLDVAAVSDISCIKTELLTMNRDIYGNYGHTPGPNAVPLGVTSGGLHEFNVGTESLSGLAFRPKPGPCSGFEMDLCAHSTSTTSLPSSLSMPLLNEYSTSLQAMKRTYSWYDYKQATPHGFPKNLDLRALDPARQTSWEFGGVENATSINRDVSPVAGTPNTRTSTSVDVNSTGLATTMKYEEMGNDSRSHEPEKVPSPIQLGAPGGADFILTSVDGTPSAASRAIGNVDPVIYMGTARITITDTKDATRANPGISLNSTNDALDDTRSKISNEHANPKFTSRAESSAIAARVAPPPGSCTVAPAPYHPEIKQPRPPHSINPVPNIGPVSTPFNTPFLPGVASYLPHPKFKPPQTNTRIADQHEIVTPGHIQASLHFPPFIYAPFPDMSQQSTISYAEGQLEGEPGTKAKRNKKVERQKLLAELDMKRQKQKASKMGGLLGFGPIPRPRPPQHHGSALGLLVCSEPPEPSPMIGDTPDLNTAPLDLRSAPQSQEETAARANNNDPIIEASDLDLGAEPTSDISEYLKVSWHPVILEMLDEVEKALADWSCGCDCLWVRE